MGLLLKNLSTVYVFVSEESEDIYVGTETIDVYSHSLKAAVQPADSRKTTEVYGERTNNMFTIYCDKGAKLNTECKVSFDNSEKPTHKIISEKQFSQRKVLIAEEEI